MLLLCRERMNELPCGFFIRLEKYISLKRIKRKILINQYERLIEITHKCNQCIAFRTDLHPSNF